MDREGYLTLGKQIPAKTLFRDEVSILAPWVASEAVLTVLQHVTGLNLGGTVKMEAAKDGKRADIVVERSSSNVVIESQFGAADESHAARLVDYAYSNQAPDVIWIAEKFDLPVLMGEAGDRTSLMGEGFRSLFGYPLRIRTVRLSVNMSGALRTPAFEYHGLTEGLSTRLQNGAVIAAPALADTKVESRELVQAIFRERAGVGVQFAATAKLIGVSPRTLRNWIDGKHEPPAWALWLLVRPR